MAVPWWSAQLRPSQKRTKYEHSTEDGWTVVELAELPAYRPRDARVPSRQPRDAPLATLPRAACQGLPGSSAASRVEDALPPHWALVAARRKENSQEAIDLARLQGVADAEGVERARDLDEATAQLKALEARGEELRREREVWERLVAVHRDGARGGAPELSEAPWTALLLRMARMGVLSANVAERGVRELRCRRSDDGERLRRRIHEICCALSRGKGRKDCTCGDQDAGDSQHADRERVAQRAAATWSRRASGPWSVARGASPPPKAAGPPVQGQQQNASALRSERSNAKRVSVLPEARGETGSQRALLLAQIAKRGAPR